ncbi:CTDP1 (predicted), partial [Pycnogonum litorale]
IANMAADCVNLVAHSDNKPIKIVEWKVTPGSHVSTGLLLFLYEDIVDDCNDKITKKYKARNVGTLHKICAEPGSVVNNTRDILFEMTACTHPTVMRDLCAECGADLRHEMPHDTSEMASVSMIHSIPELKVSHEQAIQLGRADQRRLINSKKLVLLVDLDQTLVHTTNDNIPANIKDVYHFQLYGQASPWYHTRLRPGTRQFLRNVSELYELHICTFGARTYAHMIASILDSDGKYFANRILSRDECFNPVSKTGNLKALFPCGDSMVCIIDDREDVWNFTPNLVHVKPYHFFQHTGDINAPPGLDKTDYDSDEEEDNLLSRVIKTALNRKINDDKVPKKLLKKADVVAAAVDKVDGRTVETKENGFASSKKEEVEKSKEDRVSEQSESNEVSEGSPNSESVEKSPQVKESEKDSVTAPSIANSSEGTESPKVEESEKDSVTAPSIANSSEGTKSENGLKNEKRTNGKSAGDEARTKENVSECDGFIEIEDNDDYLLYLEEILTHVHKAYFKMYEQLNKANKPDLRSVVPYVRMKVLRGTNIVFSGVIPTNLPMEKNRAYTVAKSLGASVQKNLVTPDSASDPSEVTTHLIAARSGTAKVNEAKRIKGMNIVCVDWLWSCSERWEHVEERLFPLKKTSSNRNSPVCRKSPFPADPIVQRNAAGNMAPG